MPTRIVALLTITIGLAAAASFVWTASLAWMT